MEPATIKSVLMGDFRNRKELWPYFVVNEEDEWNIKFDCFGQQRMTDPFVENVWM